MQPLQRVDPPQRDAKPSPFRTIYKKCNLEFGPPLRDSQRSRHTLATPVSADLVFDADLWT